MSAQTVTRHLAEACESDDAGSPVLQVEPKAKKPATGSTCSVPDRLGTDWGQTGYRPDTDSRPKGPEGNRTGGGHAPSRWCVPVVEQAINEAVSAVADLGAYMLAAVRRNARALEEAVDNADHSDGTGHRCSVWRFASELKSHPDLAGLPAWEAVRIVDEVLAQHGGWQLLPASDVWDCETDPRDDFLAVWDTIETPLDSVYDPLEAMPLVERWPLSSQRWPSPADEPYRRAVSVCFWYARLLDAEGKFFLACRTLGELLGVSHDRAAAYLRRATGEGLLNCVEKGSQGRASRYVFNFEGVSHVSAACSVFWNQNPQHEEKP